MRYTEEFNKKVLENTDIVKLIKKHAVLDKKDNFYIGKCMLHHDDGKSLAVFPDKQTFHCFGCGKGGNAAVFLMETKKITIDEAIRQLAKEAGIVPTEKDIEKQINAITKENLYSVYQDATMFYTRKLHEQDGEEALAYLKGRELEDQTIETFQIGFSPAKGNALYKFLKQKGYSDELMLQAGLIKISETGPYDMFRGRVMFPIMDNKNRVVAFSGRVLNPDIKPKYFNSPDSLIFNKSAVLYGLNDIKGFEKAHYYLLCEGQMDVIALHQAGFKNSVAQMGTAFTSLHVSELKKHTNNIIIATDGDEPGQKAAEKAIDSLQDAGMGIRILSLEPYKDPDEFIKALGKDEFTFRIKRSVEREDFQLKRICSQYNLNNPEERKEAFMKAVDLFIEKNDRKLFKEQDRSR